jgi:hypothetical protein
MSAAAMEGAWLRGVGEPLPAGEQLLWQGAPDWRALALRRFHARKVAVYFLLLVAWRLVSAVSAGEPLASLASGVAWLLVLGAIVVGGIAAFAWLVARTSTYAITDRRVVLRIGVALPAVLNLPLRFVESAAVEAFPDGTGTIALRLEPENRFAWLLVWPHARPWRLSEPEPALLLLADRDAAATALRAALATSVAAASAAEAADAATPAALASTGPARSLAIAT